MNTAGAINHSSASGGGHDIVPLLTIIVKPRLHDDTTREGLCCPRLVVARRAAVTIMTHFPDDDSRRLTY